jgi:hypothetical protein
MKAIAVLEADFDVTSFGTRSRLEDGLHGEPVLRRTVRQLARSERLASIHVAVEPGQRERAERLLAGTGAVVETHDAPAPPWAAPIATGGRCAAARKWSMDAWRGGLDGYTAFDEGTNIWLLEALGRRDGADVVVSVPAAAPVASPALIDAMLAHYETVRQTVRFLFVPAPPGLAGTLFETVMLAELCKAAWPPGRPLAYQPDDPKRDLLVRDCCYRPDVAIEHAAGRLVADCDRAMDRLDRLLEAHNGSAETLTPERIGAWLANDARSCAGPLPREVEIELTTDDPLPGTTLRPRGDRVPARGPIDIDRAEALFDMLARRDDSLVVFGGFGDPLRHPDFAAIVRAAADAGVFGLAVRTTALDLNDASIEAILDANVDVVSVLLDAHSAETYRAVHNADRYADAIERIEALDRARTQRPQPTPHIVPEMIKTRRTMPEMEAFYDDWIRKTGSAVIAGPAGYGGMLEDLAVRDMRPPARFACPRLWSRCLVLADGRVTLCDQDVRGDHAVEIPEAADLGSVWRGEPWSRLRDAHRREAYDTVSLCGSCREWHRP